MPTSAVSAVLFARNCPKVALFYGEVFAFTVTSWDADHARLECEGFQLVVHRIPRDIEPSVRVDEPPERRERSAIRLDFSVDDIVKARATAQRLGGGIDELPPAWAGSEARFFLGHDPEGNVFGVTLATEVGE